MRVVRELRPATPEAGRETSVPGLQSGIIAFLFTDIEGSTRLWETEQEAMSAALGRHDRLLHDVIRESGGRVFKTAGDAFCAVFPTPAAAIAAAVAGQQRIGAEHWPLATPLRVRMAVHAGHAELRDGDFFGPPLNRVARLLATAHGEQIVVSRAASELSRALLPAETVLRDLGEFALKDLQQPERIFQVVAPRLRQDFPPLRTPERLLRNLPVPAHPLIGRDDTVAAARAAFGLLAPGDAQSPAQPATRLLTLTGPGGTGKTRLALHLARDLGMELPDGAVFVPLAAITDPSHAPATIAAALESGESGAESPRAAIFEQLRDRALLLVLDNFEQVMGAAELATDLLAHCPRLRILATSRERLAVRGEMEIALSPLALPSPAAGIAGSRLPLSIDDVRQSAAVQLFVARAQSVKPGFALDEENARAIAEICTRLDGLPLAIELAAARVRLLSPRALLERFNQRLDLLSRGARDLPDRQKTMRDTIAWSYDLLEPGEQRLFANLAVFVGGSSLEAATAIAAPDEDAFETLDLLESLAEKSLLRLTGEGDEQRLWMFETIRDYARERFLERPDFRQTAQLHADYFRGLAEEAEPLLAGREQTTWLAQLDREQANLRAAIAWLREEGQPEQALRLAGSLWRFWWLRGDIGEGRGLLEGLLGAEGPASGALRAKALNGAGVLAESQGDLEQAARLHEESLAISRESGDLRAVAWSLNNLGVVAISQGQFDRARLLIEENLRVAEEVADAASIATALIDLGQVAHHQGDHARADELWSRSLELFRSLGDESHTARALNNLGTVAGERGDLARAHELLAESLAHHRGVGDRQGIAGTLNNLAGVMNSLGEIQSAQGLFLESHLLALEGGNRLHAAIAIENLALLERAQGDVAGASSHYREALGLYQAVNDREGIVSCLVQLAAFALDARDAPQAGELLVAVSALCEEQAELAPANLEEMRMALQSELGSATYAAICEAGRDLPLDQVIERAAAAARTREISGIA